MTVLTWQAVAAAVPAAAVAPYDRKTTTDSAVTCNVKQTIMKRHTVK